MKCDAAGNVWLTAPGGLWVSSPRGELIGKVAHPRARRQPALGRQRLAHAVRLRDCTSLYAVKTKVGPRMRAVHARRSAAAQAEALGHDRLAAPRAGRRFARTRPVALRAVIQDMQNDVVMDGGAFAASGSPHHCREQNAIENVTPPCRGVPRPRRYGDPCLVPRRAGRARFDAQRAAVQGPGRRQRDGARHLGRRAGARAGAPGRRPRGREDAHERLGGHLARDRS